MVLPAAETILPHSATAQREPSMEEILASIRRIIEDSDTARRTADDEMPVAANAPSARPTSMAACSVMAPARPRRCCRR